VREEQIVLGCVIAVSLAALAAIRVGGRPGAVLVAGVLGAAASGGRLAFDAIVQRDAPDADRGRTFAAFETRFQLAWVLGAFVPVLVHLPLGAGFAAIAIVGAVASVAFATGRQLTASSVMTRLRRR
jgi:hypothetical protein